MKGWRTATSYLRALTRSIGRPSATSLAGLAALAVSCCYVYLLSAQAWRDVLATAGPIPARETQVTWAVSPTPTTMAAPAATARLPTPSPTVTPTYTPLSYTPAPAYLSYTVQAGDTLSGIARRFDTTVQGLMDYNNLTGDLISIGQELLIPGQHRASASTSVDAEASTPTGSPSTPTATPTVTATATPTGLPPTVAAQRSVAPAVAQASGEPLVVAFYYTWFGLDEWTTARVPDIPAVPYESSDRNTIIRHVDQARAAGIDAFAVAWYGPQVRNNQTETNFRTVLEEAGQRDFRATIYFETRSPLFHSQGDIVEALRYLLHRHAADPAFLRYEGKPLIFFWAVADVFTASGQSGVDAWASIRQQVDPEHTSLWIADGADIDFLRVFDGHHLYNITWNPPVDVDITLSRWGREVRDFNAQHGTDKLWVATVMPGYNDLLIEGRSNRFAHDRRNGEYYRETWQAAMNSAPDLIAITSFNEWREGTQIEPSATYGDLYLQLTSELSATFRASRR